MEILHSRPGTTAAALAERLGVTDRAARRYVQTLRDAGVPVESARGPYGGYRLGGGVRLPPVVFTEDEALGLVMAVLCGHPAATEAGDAIGSALDKVIGRLPGPAGRQAEAVRTYASAVPDRRAANPDPAVTAALVAAVAARRRVTVRYRSASGNSWEAEVDPWAVIVRHGCWYLLCYCHRAGAVRSYRVDRVLALTPTGRAFARPDGLDPVALLEEHLGAGREHPTCVAFDAPIAEVAAWVRPPMGRLRRDGGGCILDGSTSNPTMYAQEWLAPIPFPYHVRGGEALRSAVATLAARCAAAVG